MRASRQWRFFSSERPSLSKEEVAYWLKTFQRILKVGVELEFNLPKQEGGCKGDNPTCDCVHVAKGCMNTCARMEECKSIKVKKDCLNSNSPVCEEDCESCKVFLLHCPEIFCVDFVSKCNACKDFFIDCKNCKQKFSEAQDPATIRRKLTTIFNPTNNWGMTGKTGIAQVTEDGSLKGDKGVEVTTVGRRLDYKSYYDMVKMICDNVLSHGGYVDERTSIHIHVLATYYRRFKKDAEKVCNISELEKPIPEIVLANIHQLYRRYQNALCWMTLGLDDPLHMTRWEKYRVSILETSAYFNHMSRVKESIMAICKDYGFINYDNCRFDENGDVRRLHYEVRVSDNIPCPSIITAMTCLYYAMTMKAVELSRYGLLEAGDSTWMELSRTMKESILNNNPREWQEDRFGNTAKVLTFERHFREQGLELLNLVKNGLMSFGPQVYEQLVRLVEMPVALRRIQTGKSWADIEADFFIPLREEEELLSAIQKVVDLRMVMDCKTPDEWIKAAFVEYPDEFRGINVEYFEEQVKSFLEKGKISWSDSLGTLI